MQRDRSYALIRTKVLSFPSQYLLDLRMSNACFHAFCFGVLSDVLVKAWMGRAAGKAAVADCNAVASEMEGTCLT